MEVALDFFAAQSLATIRLEATFGRLVAVVVAVAVASVVVGV